MIDHLGSQALGQPDFLVKNAAPLRQHGEKPDAGWPGVRPPKTKKMTNSFGPEFEKT